MKLQKFKNVLWVGGAIAACAAVLLMAGMLFNLSGGSAGAQDCDDNAIIRCGATSASDFITKAKANTTGDLAAIYSAYGLEPSMYDQFVASARPGTALKNGQIVVDGQVVGTNATSIGRLASYQGAGYFTQVIGGKSYYGNTNDKAFASDSIPVMVMFNGDGVMQFAVLNSCGNPEHATPVTPSFNCNELKSRQVDRTTYAFSTDASAGNGATIDHVVYDFGDGTTQSSTSATAEVQHTYATEGAFTTKVSVFVKLPGGTLHIIVPAGNCQKQIVVTPTPTPSITIQKDVDGVKQKQVGVGQEFVYHVKVTNTGNVDLKNVVVTDDTPPAGVTLLTADNGTVDTTANTWSFTIPTLLSGDSLTFSITAKVPTLVQGNLVNKACVNAPGAPNQPMCDTATVTVTPPSTPPSVLPNTGAGNVIGIFAGVTATAFVASQFFMQYKRLIRSAKQ